MKIMIVVLEVIGFLAAARAVLGLLFNGSRDEFVGVSAIVALICLGLLMLAFGVR